MFAGSNAAASLAGFVPDPEADPTASVACVTDTPTDVPDGKAGETLFFTTDTSYGFSIRVPTNMGDFPSFHLGYKRNEFASAPVRLRLNGCKERYKNAAMELRMLIADPSTVDGDRKRYQQRLAKLLSHLPEVDPHEISTPSFLAMNRYGSANAGVNAVKLQGGAFNASQLFATGKAAEQVASADGIAGSLAEAGRQDTALSGLTPAPPLRTRAALSAQVEQLNALLTGLGQDHIANVAASLQVAVPVGAAPDVVKASIMKKITEARSISDLAPIRHAILLEY
jgi:hypothetical protein